MFLRLFLVLSVVKFCNSVANLISKKRGDIFSYFGHAGVQNEEDIADV